MYSWTTRRHRWEETRLIIIDRRHDPPHVPPHVPPGQFWDLELGARAENRTSAAMNYTAATVVVRWRGEMTKRLAMPWIGDMTHPHEDEATIVSAMLLSVPCSSLCHAHCRGGVRRLHSCHILSFIK